jgi:hypothetical protein
MARPAKTPDPPEDPPTPEPTDGDAGGRWLDVQEAALSLFSERGYHGTTMKHVAGVVGV